MNLVRAASSRSIHRTTRESIMLRALVVAALLAVATAGCSTSGTSILVGEGKAHAPTSPEAIRMLVEPPQRTHEVIALVEGEAATDDYFTKARTEAAALAAMKEEAARIGAHAIVLTGKGTRPYGQTTIGNTIGGVQGSATESTFQASAYATSVSSSMGYEKNTFSGTAIRYTDQD